MVNQTEDFVRVIKHISDGKFNASNPVHVMYGTVTQANPVEILIEQKLPLKQANLVIPQSLTNYQVPITHNGVMSMATVHAGLKSGDKVIVLRVQGGQKFIVLGRRG